MAQTYEMDRRPDETEEAYNQRVDQLAAQSGQSRHEYIKAQSEQAGRPPIMGAGRESTAGTAGDDR